MVEFIIGIVIGLFAGSFITIFAISLSIKSKESEIYMEGFNAGYQGRWGEKNEKGEP